MKSIIDYTNKLKSFFAEKQALSNYVADYGVKNLLENTSSSLDTNGVHFVVNSDGTITVSTESGGATINTPLNIATGITINKPVKLSGCPSGGSLNSYWLDTGVTTYADIGSGVSVNSLSNATIRLVVKAGTIITTPIVFKPMITLASTPNSDYNHYVPYAKSNKELTDVVTVEDYSSQVVTVAEEVSYNQYSSQVLKMGNLVQVNLVFATSGAIAANSTLFTLPSALLSARNSAYRIIPSTDLGKKVTVNPINGVVSLSEATTAAIGNARICCTYII